MRHSAKYPPVSWEHNRCCVSSTTSRQSVSLNQPYGRQVPCTSVCEVNRSCKQSNALGFFYSAHLQARLANTAVMETCPNMFKMMRLETDKNVTDVLAVVLFANSRTFKPCFPSCKWHCHISIVYVVISGDNRRISFSLPCHLSVISVFLRSCCGRFICLGLCVTSTLLKFVSDYGFFQIIFWTSALVTETPKPVPDHHSLRISWAIVPEWQLTFDNQFL